MWTARAGWRYKTNSKMGIWKRAQIFGLSGWLCLGVAAPVMGEEGNPLKGLFKGNRSSAAAAEGRAQALPEGEVIPAPQSPAQTERRGEGNRFATPSEPTVRIPSNANQRASKPAPPTLDARSPYNPKFGMPEFVPEDQYSRAAMSKGSLATARGEELKQFTPVEIREDRRKPQEPVVVEPTAEELQAAADRKKDLFDEIYMAKSTQPPLTFESTQERVPRGPDGQPVATRNVGERVLKQYVPATKGRSADR